MEALVESGRSCYAANNYRRALKQFTRAMNLCPCNRGLRRTRCLCKDYDAVVAQNESIFKEAMYTCVCDVGKTFNKCDNILHIKALDYRAATFEAMWELERAAKDAEWMLELAPRRPDGYLRLGKVARLLKNAEFAWKVYRAGIEATVGSAESSSQKIQQLDEALRPLRMRFEKRDPMSLPLEIVYLILSHLGVVELTRCLRVSKVWNRTLTSGACKSLWRFLVFSSVPKPPSIMALRKLVERSNGDVRRIMIMDTRRFQLTPDKLRVLCLGSRNIECLELGPAMKCYYLFPKGPGMFQNLRYLSLNGWLLMDPGGSKIADDFIDGVAGTLEHLSLVGLPPNWYHRQDLPEFPNLNVLYLEHGSVHGRIRIHQTPFPIFSVASKTPRLEQLCLKHVHLDLEHVRIWRDMWNTLWKHLAVLVFFMPCRGPPARSVDTADTVALLSSLHSGNGFQHLEMDMQHANSNDPTMGRVLTGSIDLSSYGMKDANGESTWRPNQFRNLRSLRLTEVVHAPYEMKKILGDALRNGRLHTLDIVFPLPSFDGPTGRESIEHLKGYEWLRGLKSIRCMGVSRFRFQEHPRDDEDLPSFLASFPNLETLSLSSEYYSPEEFFSVVEAVIKVTHLKTIYQNRVDGARMVMLEKLAEGYGVNMLWGKRPRQWPVSLSE